MARAKQTLSPPLEAAPVAGKKRVRSEKTNEDRPKKRVKASVQLDSPTGAVLDISIAATSQLVEVAPVPAPQETPKKPRGRPKKIANVDATPAVQTTVAPSSVPTSAALPAESPKKKTKAKEKKTTGLPQLKWKIVSFPAHASSPAKTGKHSQPSTTTPPKPRIWTTNREELLAIMPEMAGSKAFHGISWELYETPILLLDETNANVFGVQKDGLDDYSLDLVTIRSFVCLRPMETIAQEPEVPPQAVAAAQSTGTKAEPSQASLTRLQGAPHISAPVLKISTKIRRAPRYEFPKGKKASFAAHVVDDTPKVDLDDEAGDEAPPTRINFAAPSLPMYSIGTGGGYPMAVDSAVPNGIAMPGQQLAFGDGEKVVKKRGWSQTKVSAAEILGPRAAVVGGKSSASASAPTTVPRTQTQLRPRNDTSSMPPPAFPASAASVTTSSNSVTIARPSTKVNFTPPVPSSYALDGNSSSIFRPPAPIPHLPPSRSQAHPVASYLYPAQPQPSHPHPRPHPQPRIPVADGHLQIVHSPSPPVTPTTPKTEFSDLESIGNLLRRGEATFLPQPQPQLQGHTLPPLESKWSSLMHDWRIKKEDTSIGHFGSSLPMGLRMEVDVDDGVLPLAFESAFHARKVGLPMGLPDSSNPQQTGRINAANSTTKHTPTSTSRLDSISTAARDIISSVLQRQPLYSNPTPSVYPRPRPRHIEKKDPVDDVAKAPATSISTSSFVTPSIPPPSDIVSDTALAGALWNDELMGPKTFQEHLTYYVPSPIPEELQALVDSYLFGRPITVIISRGLLNEYWAVEVPKDTGYVMMGYFRILGVQEARVRVEDKAKSLDSLSLSGHVEWRFRLRWAPGGEEFIMPNVDPEDLEDPWWKPPYKPPPPMPSAIEDTHSAPPQPPIPSTPFNFRSATTTWYPEEPEDHVPTTPKYRQARLKHHEYQFRHRHFRELYESLIPTYLLAPFGKRVRDLSFPRGWLCSSCGKVNFQRALRHRYCTSTACKGKTTIEPYALALFTMRDPQDRLPVSLPYNTYPLILEPQLTKFKEGMRTITYELRDDTVPKPYIKHVFTSNFPPLQENANKLLEDIQLGVELIRGYGDNSPFFSYSATCPKELSVSQTAMDWTNVPPAVNNAKKLIVHEAKGFAGIAPDLLTIDQLKIISWVTAGTKRSTESFRARKNPVVILCLGCEVALTLYPKSVEVLPTKKPGGDKREFNPWWGISASLRAEQPPAEEEAEPEEEALPAALLNASDSNAKDSEKGSPKKAKAPKKDNKSMFVLTLIHGDMAVIFGDDFDYSIKRDGTSILVVASHEVSK